MPGLSKWVLEKAKLISEPYIHSVQNKQDSVLDLSIRLATALEKIRKQESELSKLTASTQLEDAWE